MFKYFEKLDKRHDISVEQIRWSKIQIKVVFYNIPSIYDSSGKDIIVPEYSY